MMSQVGQKLHLVVAMAVMLRNLLLLLLLKWGCSLAACMLRACRLTFWLTGQK